MGAVIFAVHKVCQSSLSQICNGRGLDQENDGLDLIEIPDLMIMGGSIEKSSVLDEIIVIREGNSSNTSKVDVMVRQLE